MPLIDFIIKFYNYLLICDSIFEMFYYLLKQNKKTYNLFRLIVSRRSYICIVKYSFNYSIRFYYIYSIYTS